MKRLAGRRMGAVQDIGTLQKRFVTARRRLIETLRRVVEDPIFEVAKDLASRGRVEEGREILNDISEKCGLTAAWELYLEAEGKLLCGFRELARASAKQSVKELDGLLEQSRIDPLLRKKLVEAAMKI